MQLCHILGVPANFPLDLPRRDVPVVKLEARNTSRRLDVRPLIVAHILLQDGDNIVLALNDGALREREECVDVVGGGVEDGADKLVVDPHRRGERCETLSQLSDRDGESAYTPVPPYMVMLIDFSAPVALKCPRQSTMFSQLRSVSIK